MTDLQKLYAIVDEFKSCILVYDDPSRRELVSRCHYLLDRIQALDMRDDLSGRRWMVKPSIVG